MTTETLLPEKRTTDPTLLPRTLICFSHLRWNFVYQRPQQLLSRMTSTFNIYFVEEPIFDAAQTANVVSIGEQVTIVVPHIAGGITDAISAQRYLLDDLIRQYKIDDFALWYYTPMALLFSGHLQPGITIYDCMDELSAFDFAPVELKQLEQKLMQKADIVFTGGHSLYHAKKQQHPNIHPFPSSVEKKHFGRARHITAVPGDQAKIAAPRMGFFGVIDERFDTVLIEQVARLRPDWHIILIGPIVKIDPATLPQQHNIHYLGSKAYSELPDYVSGWDIALIPFKLNRSTEFISPTKTPEYLSAGVPVIATPIKDVVTPYGTNGLVQIAATPGQFINAAENVLYGNAADKHWLGKIDDFLSHHSWEVTVEKMLEKIEAVATSKKTPLILTSNSYGKSNALSLYNPGNK